MKKKIFLTGLLGLSLLGLYFLQVTSPQPVLAIASTVIPTPSSSVVREAMQVSDDLTTKWLQSLDSDGWLFVSYKDEILLGDPGIDPETGQPLPTQSLWETWYMLDEKGRQTTVISQRTDLVLGNVTQTIWQDRKLLRLPSNVSEDTRESGRAWESYRPLRDHFCNTMVSNFINPSTDSTSQEIQSEWKTTTEGNKQWVLTMSMYYSPVSDAFKDINAIGNQNICYRNGDTGEIASTEHFVITDMGEHILISRTYNYFAVRAKEPPSEILSLLDLLSAKSIQQ